MRRLLPLLVLLFSLPLYAGIFDQKPSTIPGFSLNNSSDFLPVGEAFKLSLIDRTDDQIQLRFVNAEGYYLYRHRFAVKSEPATAALGDLQLRAGVRKQDE